MHGEPHRVDPIPTDHHAGVHEIEQEDRDKIVFLTAGIAVLSLLVNGTTTGPLVRILKLDR